MGRMLLKQRPAVRYLVNDVPYDQRLGTLGPEQGTCYLILNQPRESMYKDKADLLRPDSVKM